jgi:hypothetical protein
METPDPTPLTEDALRQKAEEIMEKCSPPAWKGFCPESALNGKSVRMRLNDDDFFESEETHLQICVVPGLMATILNFRGAGKFRSAPCFADEAAGDEILCPQSLDMPPFGHAFEGFQKSEEMATYIQNTL